MTSSPESLSQCASTARFQPFTAGDCLHRIWICDGWRVLDVGSGQSPHPRADVLLERYPEENRHRAGDPIDVSDPRLVVGDACDMPFADAEFDFVIASHIAEHVDDPRAFCRELARVGHRGYIETPGWLGDMLLREEFHLWRVRKRNDGLDFEAVANPRPLGWVADAFYALLYAGVAREGHRTLLATRRPGRMVLSIIRRTMTRLIWLPWVRDRIYMRFEWSGPFPVTVRNLGDPYGKG